MAPTRSQLIETATALVQSFEKWTIEGVMSKRSPTSTHQMLPESLGYPLYDRAGFQKHIEDLMPMIPDGFKVTANYKPPVVDEATRTVVLFAKCTADTPVGPYANEYIFIITMNEEGTLADKVEEVLDSQLVNNLLSKLGPLRAQNQ